jgi:outer membrane protein OmpA-like peptidoglycan-associated protein
MVPLGIVLMVMAGGHLHAQTAAEMDALLEANAVSFVQAAHFTLVTADVLGEYAAASDAYALARERGWLPSKAETGGSIRLGELCFLIMNAFNIKGSFLYFLFPGPRYAFRELDYLKLIPGRRDPALKVSGERFLQILGGVTAYTGAGLSGPPAVAAGPVPPAVMAGPEPPAVMAEREQMAEFIQSDLEQSEIADTTVRVEEEGIVISLSNIQFLPDSVELTEGEKNKLREIAVILSQYPGKLLVAGHAAAAGDATTWMRLSTERAKAVADFLVVLGAREREEVRVQGYGAQRPLGDNTTAKGQALNRRVEIILLDE